MLKNQIKFLLSSFELSIRMPFFQLNSTLKLTFPIIANFYSINKKTSPYPPLNECEIIETFSNGSGPGGQKTNKTHNRCQLKHIPTGNQINNFQFLTIFFGQ